MSSRAEGLGREGRGQPPEHALQEPSPQRAGIEMLRLQAAAGNARVARLLAGRALIQRDDTTPRPSLPGLPPVDPVPGLMRKAVHDAMIETIAAEAGQPEFATTFSSKLRGSLAATVAQPDIDAMQPRAAKLSAVSVDFRSEKYDFLTTARLLQRIAGLPPELDRGRSSYGADLFINRTAEDVTNYVYQGAAAFEMVTGSLSNFLASIENPRDLLELELEGAVAALLRLREGFALSKNHDERAAMGTEMGEVSRRILLLNGAIAELAKAPGVPATAGVGPLEEALKPATSKIDEIRSHAASEEGTRGVLGDKPELLAPHAISTTEEFTAAPGAATSVEAEEAFPRMSDAASASMIEDLTSQVQSQAVAARNARSSVIPDAHPPGFPELIAAYDRWFAFFSPEARDADPLYRQLNQLYEGMWGVFGKGGAEGGFGRMLLMQVFGEHVGEIIHGATPDFAGEVARAGLNREQTLSGTATSPSYRYADKYAGGTSADLGTSGEEASRAELIRRRSRETQRAFGTVQTMSRAGQPIEQAAHDLGVLPPGSGSVGRLFLQSEQARTAWSYLISYREPVSGMVTREEKSMPPEVANYLLAREQQLETLSKRHMPGIGEFSVVAGGVEAAGGTAASRFVEGRTDDDLKKGPASSTQRRVEASQAELGRAADAAKPKVGGWGSRQAQVVEELIANLETYLDEYFTAHDSAEYRVAAVLRIANREYDVAGRFLHYLEPDELVEAIGIALAIETILSVLRKFGGVVGFILSEAIERLLEANNITGGAAALGALAFFTDASSASSFHQARGKAYFAKGVADDLGQLCQQLAVSAGLKGLKVVAGSKSSSPADVVRDLDPIMRDPAQREQLRQEVDDAITKKHEQGAGTQESDPELQQLLELRAALRGEPAPVAGPSAPAGPGATGAVRGRDVYQHLPPGEQMRPMRLDREIRRQLVPATDFAVAGTRMHPVDTNEFRLEVPQQGGGGAEVDINVRVVPPGELGAAHAHGGEAGPARVHLRAPAHAGGRWHAEIRVADTLMPENVRFVVGHEVDEVAGIVSRHTAPTEATIAGEMEAGIFAPAAPAGAPVTAHDRAAAFELYELHVAQLEATRELHIAHRNNDTNTIREWEGRLQRRTESMDRLVDAMGLTEVANNAAKIETLRQAGPGDAWQDFLFEVQHVGAAEVSARYLAAAGGARAGGGTIVDTALVAHLMYANPHSSRPGAEVGIFRERGIFGGHDDASLQTFVNGNPQYGYAVVQEHIRTNGGTTYRTYAQYMWTGAGQMPPPGAGNYPTAGGATPAGWVRAEVPKTTTTDFVGMMSEADAAIATYRTANAGAMPPDGEVRLAGPSGMPVTMFVRGARVVTVHLDEAWIAGGGPPAAAPAAPPAPPPPPVPAGGGGS